MGEPRTVPIEWTGDWWPWGTPDDLDPSLGEGRCATYRLDLGWCFRWRPWCSEHHWLGTNLHGGFSNPESASRMAKHHMRSEHGVDHDAEDY